MFVTTMATTTDLVLPLRLPHSMVVATTRLGKWQSLVSSGRLPEVSIFNSLSPSPRRPMSLLSALQILAVSFLNIRPPPLNSIRDGE